MSTDVSALNRLVSDMEAASGAVQRESRGVLQKGALNVKMDAQKFASGLAHAPHYPSSITYDTRITAHGIVAEIGPDKSRTQGALGNILEYGTSNNAPITHLGPALDREGPNLEKALADLAAKALL